MSVIQISQDAHAAASSNPESLAGGSSGPWTELPARRASHTMVWWGRGLADTMKQPFVASHPGHHDRATQRDLYALSPSLQYFKLPPRSDQ